jgi:hypothetical protein
VVLPDESALVIGWPLAGEVEADASAAESLLQPVKAVTAMTNSARNGILVFIIFISLL